MQQTAWCWVRQKLATTSRLNPSFCRPITGLLRVCCFVVVFKLSRFIKCSKVVGGLESSVREQVDEHQSPKHHGPGAWKGETERGNGGKERQGRTGNGSIGHRGMSGPKKFPETESFREIHAHFVKCIKFISLIMVCSANNNWTIHLHVQTETAGYGVKAKQSKAINSRIIIGMLYMRVGLCTADDIHTA